MWQITKILLLSGVILLGATVLLTLFVERFNEKIWFKISYTVIAVSVVTGVINFLLMIGE